MRVPGSQLATARTDHAQVYLTVFARSLEEALKDPDLTAEARLDLMLKIKADLERATAVTDTFIQEAEAAGELEATVFEMARHHADLREELIRRGMASPERLDECGFVGHDTLDSWAEAGTLQENAVEAFTKAWGLGLLKGTAFNAKVRRGFGGRFTDKPGAPKVAAGRGGAKIKSAVPHEPHAKSHQPVHSLVHPTALGARALTYDEDHLPGGGRRDTGGKPIRQIKGVRGGVKGKESKVFKSPEKPGEKSTRQEEHDAAARGDKPGMSAEEKKAKFTERRAKLEKKTKSAAASAGKAGERQASRDLQATELARKADKARGVAAKATGEEKAQLEKTADALDKQRAEVEKPVEGMTEAEAHFNAAGRVSQRTLLAYVTEAASQPTTVERYRNPDGSYHPSRKALHDRIIDMMLRGRDPVEGKPDFEGTPSATNDYLPSQDNPEVLFSGGGYAAGKSSMLKALGARQQLPPDSVVINPDDIKALLPEYDAALESDPEANLLAYEEAWDIAQELMAQARVRRMNIIVDGISNTDADEMFARVKGFEEAGYVNPKVAYVTVPTDVAIQRADKRAENATDKADRRVIPEVIMRAVHRDVSATVSDMLDRAHHEVPGLEIEVYDTNQGKDAETGQHRPPKMIASLARGEQSALIHDEGLFQQFVNKADEGIEGVDKPGEGQRAMPGRAKLKVTPVRIDPKVEARVQEIVENAMSDEDKTLPKNAPSQKAADFDTLYKQAEEGFQGFSDLLSEIGDVLGAERHDLFGEDVTAFDPKLYDGAKEAVASGLNRAHTIVGALKGRERAEEKARGSRGVAGMDDLVRGTVVIPSMSDFDTLWSTIREKAEAKGWKVSSFKNRMVTTDRPNSPGKTKEGYRDLKLTLESPDGFQTELQVNTTQNWVAKESDGHKLYEEIRPIAEEIERTKRDPTPREKAIIERVMADSRRLYNNSWAASIAALAEDAAQVAEEQKAA